MILSLSHHLLLLLAADADAATSVVQELRASGGSSKSATSSKSTDTMPWVDTDDVEHIGPLSNAPSCVVNSTIDAAIYDLSDDCISSASGYKAQRITAPGRFYRVAGDGGEITADTVSGHTTHRDTKVAVYHETNGTCVTGNDDENYPDGRNSTVTWESLDGAGYYVLVHGFADFAGQFELCVFTSLNVMGTRLGTAGPQGAGAEPDDEIASPEDDLYWSNLSQAVGPAAASATTDEQTGTGSKLQADPLLHLPTNTPTVGPAPTGLTPDVDEAARTGGFGPLTNFARNRPSDQTTTCNGGVASRANDGIVAPLWSSGSISETCEGADQKWTVDLGSVPIAIESIVLHNRMDPCCSGRLEKAIVQILGEDGATVVAEKHTWDFRSSQVYRYDFDRVRGHRVRIVKPDYGILNLVEVEVMGRAVP